MILNRHLVAPLLLAAAVGVPVLIYESGWNPSAADPAASPGTPDSETAAFGPYSTSLHPAELNRQTQVTLAPGTISPVRPSPVPAQIVSTPSNHSSSTGNPNPFSATAYSQIAPPMDYVDQLPVSISDALRFEILPDWVKTRWERISTTPKDSELFGMRVALVTGVNPQDIHGSLTYYFDKSDQLQRITFRGWTGDATQLVQLLSSRFQFQAKETHMGALYVAKSFFGVKGALMLQNAAVIRATTPTQQVAVSLEINNPNGSLSLSNEFSSTLPR